MKRRMQVVDVFSPDAYRGNPVAVVLDSEGLDTETMQRFANWMNLSETTFLVPPTSADADYAVRIFTPTVELPFAGHPTLGTCHSFLSRAGDLGAGAGAHRGREVDGGGGPTTGPGSGPSARNNVVQECRAGLVPIERTSDGLAFAAPPLVREGPVDDADVDRVVAALAVDRDDVVDIRWADNGPGFIGVLLRDADAVLALEPGSLGGLLLGVAGPHPAGSPTDHEVRVFFPVGATTVEDPVTGSFNAALAQWLLGSGRATAPYVASQGTVLGRVGRVYISQSDDGTVHVGGATATLLTGEVDL